MSGSERMVPPSGRFERCENCHHWWEAKKAGFVQTAQGAVPAAQLIQQGKMPAGAVVIVSAPCTVFPRWEQTPAEGWCGQFKARGLPHA